MANPEHLKILKQSVIAFNKWRQDNPKIEPNLSQADLEGADLSLADLMEANLGGAHLDYAKFINANLHKANLHMANLRGANFHNANLHKADLSSANLDKAILHKADLSSANLRWAVLSYADLTRADLSEANLKHVDIVQANFKSTSLNKTCFKHAIIGGTSFGDTDLSTVADLESTRHLGPSIIGIDTIFLSGGKIPNKFLDDAGVPEIFTKYMGSLIGKAFQYYSCFVSYSTDDKDFASRIHADLRNEGVRCWFAPEDIKAGKKLHLQLDEAIRIHDKLLLILSEKSIASDWVENEIKWARKREKQDGKQKLFPVTLIDYKKLEGWQLFDTETATDLAAEVRSYFIPDFTNWKDHDSYKHAFERLLSDLKADENDKYNSIG